MYQPVARLVVTPSSRRQTSRTSSSRQTILQTHTKLVRCTRYLPLTGRTVRISGVCAAGRPSEGRLIRHTSSPRKYIYTAVLCCGHNDNHQTETLAEPISRMRDTVVHNTRYCCTVFGTTVKALLNGRRDSIWMHFGTLSSHRQFSVHLHVPDTHIDIPGTVVRNRNAETHAPTVAHTDETRLRRAHGPGSTAHRHALVTREKQCIYARSARAYRRPRATRDPYCGLVAMLVACSFEPLSTASRQMPNSSSASASFLSATAGSPFDLMPAK